MSMSSNPEIEVAPPVVANPTPTLTAIRAATGELHARLDDALTIAGPDPGPEEYAIHVAAMLGWTEPIEAALAQAEWPAALEIERRLVKSRWLTDDLHTAGLDDAAIAALPRCRMLPPLDTAARRYGVLYVLEGSTLGGRVLHRRLTDRMPAWPLAALVGYGRATGPLWSIFVANIEQAGATDFSHGGAPFAHAAAESAAGAFRNLLDWLQNMGAACRVR